VLPLYKAAPKNFALCVAFHACCRFTKRRQRTLLYVLLSMRAAALQSGAKELCSMCCIPCVLPLYKAAPKNFALCVAFHACRFFFLNNGAEPP
jgi:hypothetical protein